MTLYLHGWMVPAAVSVIAILGGIAVFIADCRSARGDFSAPLVGFLALVCGVLAAVVAWGAYLALRFTGL